MKRAILRVGNSFLAVILTVSVFGCSIFVPREQPIMINGEPSGAKLVVNGQMMTAPAQLSVPRNRAVMITVQKEGYHPYTMTSSYHLSTTGILDFIGGWGFFVPFIGLATPGAYTLDYDIFYYALTPVEQK